MFGSLICLAKLSCSICCLVRVTFNQVITCNFITQNIIPVAIYYVMCMYVLFDLQRMPVLQPLVDQL